MALLEGHTHPVWSAFTPCWRETFTFLSWWCLHAYLHACRVALLELALSGVGFITCYMGNVTCLKSQ
jgi:hypothetical protein